MQCTANTSQGNPCKKDAIAGASVCRFHGGAAPQVKAQAAVRAEVMRWTLGDAVDDPGEVLLRLVTQSRMRADAYAEELEELVAASGGSLTDILTGNTYFEGAKTGEYIRGIVQLEAQERDRLAGFASKAIAAGLAERQVRLAERQGELLAELMRMIVTDPEMGFTDTQREAMPRVLRRHLALVQAG